MPSKSLNFLATTTSVLSLVLCCLPLKKSDFELFTRLLLRYRLFSQPDHGPALNTIHGQCHVDATAWMDTTMSALGVHDEVVRLHKESLRLHEESLRLHEQSLERLGEALKLQQQVADAQKDGA